MNTETSTEAAKVKEILAQSVNRAVEQIADDDKLTDLVAESFALVEAIISLQEELDIRLAQDDLRDVETVIDLIRVCAKRM